MRQKEEEVKRFERLLHSRQLFLILSHLIFTEVFPGRDDHFPFIDEETAVAEVVLVEDHTDRTRIQI